MPEDTTTEQEKEKSAITDEMREEIFEKIGKICTDYNIPHACFLGVDPGSQEPVMFFRGNKITVARLTALFTKLIRDEIMQQLSL